MGRYLTRLLALSGAGSLVAAAGASALSNPPKVLASSTTTAAAAPASPLPPSLSLPSAWNPVGAHDAVAVAVATDAFVSWALWPTKPSRPNSPSPSLPRCSFPLREVAATAFWMAAIQSLRACSLAASHCKLSSSAAAAADAVASLTPPPPPPLPLLMLCKCFTTNLCSPSPEAAALVMLGTSIVPFGVSRSSNDS